MLGEFDVIPSIIGILVLVIPAMLLGKLCSHFKLSEIIGFVIAGIIFGPFAIGSVIPFQDKSLVVLDDLVLSFWQISGIVILFSAGLHFTFHDLRKAGFRAATVGIGGVVLPLFLGFLVSNFLGFDWLVSIVIGAAISATSITIAVTVLEELGKEKTKEGNILVNAAVLDDVLGLAILSAVTSVIVTESLPTIESIAFLTAESIGFWFLILLGSVFIIPKIMHYAATARPASLESRGTNQAAAIGSAFGIAAIAGSLGLNPIVGAFAAGMGLAGSKFAHQVREFVGRLKVMFAPLFFSVIGAHVDIGRVLDINGVVFVAILGIAIISKVLGSGIPAGIFLHNKVKGWRIGFGMIARGEIAFVTIGVGISHGILTESVYATLVFVILGTIFISPSLLKKSFSRNEK